MKRNVVLIVLLLVFTPGKAGEVITLPGLNRPDQISIDKDHIYICDKEKIHIFALKDYQLVTSFGKRGEGPGEFRFRIDIAINTQTDDIIVESQGKLSFFTKKGQLIKEIRLTGAGGCRPLGNGFVATSRTFIENSRYSTLNFFNEKLEKTGEIYKSIIQPGGKKIRFLGTTWEYITCKDKVFICAKKDFVVDVIDKTGKMLFSIKRDYERIKIDRSFVNNFFAWVKKNRPPRMYAQMKRMFEFPDYMPAIYDIVIDKDILYIITYKRKREMNEVFLYTTEGKFIKTLDIPLYKDHPIDPLPYTIYDGKIFQLIDNAETEEWELRVTPILIYN
ncbi:MAG: 6-bladed beta-propeller [Candidatus Aminicenantes bacterium]|jgi:hypothetical protein